MSDSDGAAAEQPQQPPQPESARDIILRQLLAQGEAITGILKHLRQEKRARTPESDSSDSSGDQETMGVPINPHKSAFGPPHAARYDWERADKNFHVLNYDGRVWAAPLTQLGPDGRNRRKAQLDEAYFMTSLSFYIEPVLDSLLSVIADLTDSEPDAVDLGVVLSLLSDVGHSLKAIKEGVVTRTGFLHRKALQPDSLETEYVEAETRQKLRSVPTRSVGDRRRSRPLREGDAGVRAQGPCQERGDERVGQRGRRQRRESLLQACSAQAERGGQGAEPRRRRWPGRSWPRGGRARWARGRSEQLLS